MKITCGTDFIETSCTGCPCHENAIQFGALVHGCCSECSCPKTLEAFRTAQERSDYVG